MERIKVLIVDDSNEFVESTSDYFMNEPGFTVVGSASSGREAVDKAREHAPDLVLMDIAMPGTNGLEATRLIKEKVSAPKVVILTLYDTDEYRNMAERVGADGFMKHFAEYPVACHGDECMLCAEGYKGGAKHPLST